MRAASFAAGLDAVLWAVAEGLEQPFYHVAYKWGTHDLYAGLIRLEARTALRKYEERKTAKAAKPTKFGTQWR